MGCWCETDGVTQLPINAGDKIRIFVLRQQATEEIGRGTCYNTDAWCPIGPAVKGKYNDYGSAEKIIEDRNSNIILEILRKDLVDNLKESKREYVEIPDSYETSSLEEIFNLIERDYVKIKGRFGKPVEVGLFMVLEEVYQALIKYNPIVTHRIAEGQFEYMPYQQSMLMETENWYKKTSYYQKLFKSATDEKDRINYMSCMMMVSDIAGGLFSDYRELSLKEYRISILNHIKDEIPFEDEKVQNILSAVSETVSFNGSMQSARKQWYPQTGKGSQDNELDIYKIINKCTDQIIKKREKQNIKDGCELPNKEGYLPYMLKHNASLRQNNGNQKVSSEKTK